MSSAFEVSRSVSFLIACGEFVGVSGEGPAQASSRKSGDLFLFCSIGGELRPAGTSAFRRGGSVRRGFQFKAAKAKAFLQYPIVEEWSYE